MMPKQDITIGNLSGHAIFGGEKNTATVNYTTNDISEIRTLVRELLADQDQWKSSVDQKDVDVLLAQLQALRALVEADQPKESAITACLKSLQATLAGAAEQAAYGGLLQALIIFAPK